MALPNPVRLARRSIETAVDVATTGTMVAAGSAVLTAGLLTGSARLGVRAARAAVDATSTVAGGSFALAKSAAVGGIRLAGTVVTGADPVPDGGVQQLAEVARGMVEPPMARHTRRVWSARGRTHVELAAPAVEWATVNHVVGRVLVSFDERRIHAEDVVGVVTAIEQARGGKQVFPQRADHPADLEPFLAATAAAAIDVAAVGVAMAGKLLPVPAVTRHATLALALLDSQHWIKKGLITRIGPVGTDLVFTGTSALLHAMTQSPTVPALNAAAALQRMFEIRARRAVWPHREAELCLAAPEDTDDVPLPPPGERPVPMPSGPVESYRGTLGPVALASAVGLLPLTRRTGRSADMLKALTPKAAVHGREAFAAALDLMMCRRGVLPLDGSAYRRLDRVDTVVVHSDALCTGPPVVLRASAEADGWDEAAVWTSAARLLGSDDAGGEDGLRLGPAEEHAEAPGGCVRVLLDGDERVGTVVVAAELDPHAEALLQAVAQAGHRLVLTAHVGTEEVAGAADEVSASDEPQVETVRRAQAAGNGVLVISASDGPALLAADVAVAPGGPFPPAVHRTR